MQAEQKVQELIAQSESPCSAILDHVLVNFTWQAIASSESDKNKSNITEPGDSDLCHSRWRGMGSFSPVSQRSFTRLKERKEGGVNLKWLLKCRLCSPYVLPSAPAHQCEKGCLHMSLEELFNFTLWWRPSFHVFEDQKSVSTHHHRNPPSTSWRAFLKSNEFWRAAVKVSEREFFLISTSILLIHAT